MHKRITFKNMERSVAAENYAQEKLDKVVEFLAQERTPVYIDMVMESSKTREHHKIELRVKSPSYDLVSHIEKEGVPFYQAIDDVIDTMVRQLHEAKRKLVDERDHGHPSRAEDFEKNR